MNDLYTHLCYHILMGWGKMSEGTYDLYDIKRTIRDAFYSGNYPEIHVVLLPFDFKSGIFYVVAGDDVVFALVEKGVYELTGDTLTLVIENRRPIYLKMKKVERKKE